MKIAVIIKERCHPDKCQEVCIRFCPRVRAGVVDTIKMGEDGKPLVSEELCIACGICVNKCPFDAIKIIGLPEELESTAIHRYGENGFRLFNLPQPRKGEIIGILGQNGVGKTTALNILGGQLIPNLGQLDKAPDWSRVIEHFEGTEMGTYLKSLADGELKCSLKPQYVDTLPEAYEGKIGDLLEGGYELMKEMDLLELKEKKLDEISGGELQRVAIAKAMMKDADVYLFDEPSSYLDIYQRLKVAGAIRKLAEDKSVVVVEHDLAVLDYLADEVHLIYGSEGAYGIVTQPYRVRNAINIYLKGFLPKENIRFRDREITFEKHPPREAAERKAIISFGPLMKKYERFRLDVEGGELYSGEVVGVVGPNAIGKTTFIMMLAGVIEPDSGEVDRRVKVSYKPQYLRAESDATVYELFSKVARTLLSPYYSAMVVEPLGLKPLFNRGLNALSGGELQRVAVALCLGRDADLYLIDEPSAYMDSSQRMEVAKVIKRVVESSGKSAYVVDHDIYFIDMLADKLMVFEGIPAKFGKASKPTSMRDGMNLFFSQLGLTFRRDEETNRPRVNKPESKLDREQKSRGEYYYVE
ncbi:MAG: ribosome biogenesis/translation initiation ATPase RLI [Candidatus Thermoplasmatota archaeon]|nr:ribosome biogenesis/translation initiation ATPase RLI [Candidatus Thermoplasmatota archaeon]